MNDQIPSSIPKFLYPFFWDVDPKMVNPNESSHYVINRLLDKGTLEAARWVLQTFPQENIIDTLKQGKNFSEKTLSFWSAYYSIPKEEIICFQEPFRSQRKQHWAY